MPTKSAFEAGEAGAESGPTTSPEYRAAREAFNKLEPAAKATFLLESAFGAAGEFVAEAAKTVSDVVEKAGQSEFWQKPAGETAGAGATASTGSAKRGPSTGSTTPPDTSWGPPNDEPAGGDGA
jgi:hypothetical protein